MEVSVIVAVFNVEDYLRKCLDSILSQSYSDFELILIDDGSTDHSDEICDEYQIKDDRVKVIHQSNSGIGRTRNKGLQVSKGEYIYFCDPDDYLEPNLLEDNIKLIKRHEANLIIFGYFDEIVHGEKVAKIRRTPHATSYLKNKIDFIKEFEKLHSSNIMYTVWNKIYRKSYLSKNNYKFEEIDIGEDTRFNWIVYRNLDKVWINKNVYYHYCLKRSNSAVNQARKDYFKLRYGEVKLFEKLIEDWGMENGFQKLINNEWINTLVFGIKSILKNNGTLNEEDMLREINQLIKNEKVSSAIKKLSFFEYSGSLRVKIKKKIFIKANRRICFEFLKHVYKIH